MRHVPDLRKKPSLVGSLESSRMQILRHRWSSKGTKDFMMILKAQRTENLYKVIRSVVIGDASIATENEDITRL